MTLRMYVNMALAVDHWRPDEVHNGELNTTKL